MDKEDRRELAKAWLRISEIFAAALVAAPIGAFLIGKQITPLRLFVALIIGSVAVLTPMAVALRILKGRWR